MSSKLFVGGLSFGTDDASLRAAFEAFGEIAEARVVLDRETGRSRGFGFVTYRRPESARSAMDRMQGAAVDGRAIRVDLAEDRRGPGGPREGAGFRPGPPRDGGRDGGFGGPRDGGFRSGPPRDAGFGGGRDGGFRPGPPRDGGFGPPRDGGFGPPRDGGFRPGPPREGGFGGPREGGFRPGPPRDGAPGGAREGGFRADRPFGDRPPPRRPDGGAPTFPRRPSGPGGFGVGPPPEEEGAWDDARIRRAEPKKHRERVEPEADRRAAKAAVEKPKRESGRSWRHWDLDDEEPELE